MADININIKIERRIFLVIFRFVLFLFLLFEKVISRKFSNTQTINIINNSVLSH